MTEIRCVGILYTLIYIIVSKLLRGGAVVKKLISMAVLAVFVLGLVGCYTPPPIPDNINPTKLEKARTEAENAEKELSSKEAEEKKLEGQLENKKEELNGIKKDIQEREDVLEKLNNGTL